MSSFTQTLTTVYFDRVTKYYLDRYDHIYQTTLAMNTYPENSLYEVYKWANEKYIRLESYYNYLKYLVHTQNWVEIDLALNDDWYSKNVLDRRRVIVPSNPYKYSLRKFDNSINFNLLPVEECNLVVSDEEEICSDYILKKNKVRRNYYKSDESQQGVYRPHIDNRDFSFYDRIVQIKIRLKEFFRNIRVLGYKSSYKILLDREVWTVAYPQAGDGETFGGDPVASTDIRNNVVLTENQLMQHDQTITYQRQWAQAASSDVVANHDTLVNRYFPVETFNWTTSQTNGVTLSSIDLPRVLLAANNSCDYPNTIPFRVHSKWRGDIVVKILLNANKFQVGQLQVSWYYQPKYDSVFALRGNQYSRSTTSHVIINASPNNEVSMNIPFRTYKTLLNTRKRDDGPISLDLGTLFITVLNRLTVSNNTSQHCSGTVYIALENNQFTGMINGSIGTIIEPQGLLDSLIPIVTPLLRSGAEGLLNQILPDPNRDNPPNVTPASMLVPASSNSWSTGTGCVEPINNLRLDNRGQTAHIDSSDDEMTIAFVIRKFMLFSQGKWSFQDQRGVLLYSVPANPCVKGYVISNGSTNRLPVYQFTSLTYVSCLYEFWRGSLEYRFDFVATPYHSGRVLLAYIPGVEDDAIVTLEQARASPHVVVSLDDTMSYTWIVPYVSDRIWWRRRYAGNSTENNNYSPSKVFMFVLNPLVFVDNVTQVIEFNVYIRAGDDFEFSVPVQPSIGLGYNNVYIPEYDENVVTQVPQVRGFYISVDNSFVKFFDLPIGDNRTLSVFTPPIIDRRVVYMYNTTEPQQNPPPIVNAGAPFNVDITCTYAFIVGIGGNWRGLPIRHDPNITASVARIEAIAEFLASKEYSFSDSTAVASDLRPYVLRDPRLVTESDFGFLPISVSNPRGGGGGTASYISQDLLTLEDLVVSEGNREDTLIVVDPSRTLVSTGSGVMTFGEQFVDLKDLCRRYQLYASFTVLRDLITNVIGRCSVIIPLLPQGLDLDNNNEVNINRIYNRSRDGHIPLILNMYRHYRGSLRFRLIVSNGQGLFVWIQHRPDRRLNSLSVKYCYNVETAEAVFNNGYAYYIQDLSVNSIIQIEIPFYQAGNFGLLQRPDLNASDEILQFYSLGELSIGFFGLQPSQNLQCQLFYSIADDFRAYTFQGPPPSVLLDDLPSARPQGPSGYHVAQYQGIGDWMSFGISKQVENHGERVGSVIASEIKSTSQDILSNLKESLDSVVERITENFAQPIKQTVSAMISQFVHIAVSPTIKTITVAIASILLQIGVVALTSFERLVAMLRLIFTSFVPKEQQDGNDTEVVSPQAGDKSSEHAATGLISLLIGGLCALFNIKQNDYRAGKESYWYSNLFSGIDRGMKLSNTCFIFMRNLFLVLEDMKIYVLSLFSSQYRALRALTDNKDLISRWVSKSLDICDASYISQIRYSLRKQNEFYDALSLGKLLYIKCLDIEDVTIRQTISRTFSELKKIDQKLTTEGVSPHVRKMPFSIYMVGERNIGKSFLTSTVIAELLESQEIKSETEMMCILTPASQYWDNCDRQPALVIDDLFSICEPTMLAAQLYAIFATVTPVILVPPKAELEQKGRPYAPEIFWMNSNVSYFNHSYVTSQQALWRRRDILIEAALNEEKKPNCKHCEKGWGPSEVPSEYHETLNDFHHLKFRYKLKVDDPKVPYGDWINYSQLLTMLKLKFADNRKVAEKNFRLLLKENARVTGAETICDANINSLEVEWRKAIAHRRSLSKKMEKGIFHELKRSITDNVILDKIKWWWENMHKSGVKPRSDACEECRKAQDMCSGCLFLHSKVEVVQEEQNDIDAPSTSGTQSLFSDIISNAIKESRDELNSSSSSSSTSSIEVVSKETVAPESEAEIDIYWKAFKIQYMNCGKSTLDYVSSLKRGVDDFIFERFLKMLIEPRVSSKIMSHISKKPLYTRDAELFKSIVSLVFTCDHTGTPVYSNGHLRIGEIRISDMLNKDMDLAAVCEDCVFHLPWHIRNVARNCMRLYGVVENWGSNYTSDLAQYHSKCSMAKFWDLVKSYLTGFVDKILTPCAKAVWQFIYSGKMLTCFIAVFLGFNMWHVYKDNFSSVVENDTTWYEAKGYEAVKPKVMSRIPPNVAKPQSANKTSQQFDYLIKNLHNNFVYLVTVTGCVVREFCCLGIRDREVLLQKHYWDEACRADYVYIKYDSYRNPNDPKLLGIPIDITNINVRWFCKTDNIDADVLTSNFGIITCPRSVRPFKNIVNFFANSREHSICKLSNCALYEHGSKTVYMLPVTSYNNLHIAQTKEVYKNSVNLSQCYRYSLQNPGFCGSILLCCNSSTPILGMHVAGSNLGGYAEPLIYDSFVDIKPTKDEFMLPIADFHLEEVEYEQCKLPSTLYPLGLVPKELKHSQSGKSSYIPSKLFGLYPVTSEPNPLIKNDPRQPPDSDPLIDGISFMGCPPLDFHSNLLTPAKMNLQQLLIDRICPERQIGLISLQDAVCGRGGVSGYEPLSWNTSEGFPLRAMRPNGVSGKKWLFTLEESTDGYVLKNIHSELHRLLKIEYNHRKRGLAVPTTFVDNLKDTCIDKEKCKIRGKTRIFSISPVQYTIAFKQYFGDFMALYQQNRLNVEHGIGIDVNSWDWSELAQHLQAKGKKIIAGDYKNFGPGLMMSCVVAACDIILRWYEYYDKDQERNMIRRVLLSELINARHLSEDIVYTVSSGIPSGSPITTPLNSIVNSLYIRCAWLSLTGTSCEQLLKSCNIVTFGDDVCINVSDEYVEIFNTETMNSFFKKYNITFTDVDKGDTIVKYRTLNDVTFLKRGFSKHPTIPFCYLAPINEDSIYKCVNWIKKTGDPVLNTLEHCEQACELAFGRGREYYDELRDTLIKGCRSQGFGIPNLPLWDEVSFRCYNK